MSIKKIIAKPQLLLSLICILVITSCAKKIDILAQKTDSAAIQSTTNDAANIGTPFKGTNVSWKINPLDANNTALIAYSPNSNSGYEVIMIDNGITNTNTPINAFRFVSVNLNTKNYKIIKIKNPSTGVEVPSSMGRVFKYTFGMNKKLYVATQGSDGGGGHIIEYDPNTQIALDLGKPFLIDGRYLDIYSLSVGVDGALYGGSSGGSGDVMTFRYNYTGNFEVDNSVLDNDSRYVSYISGDATYTYASCGENSWKLYAINRSTKEKNIILTYNNSDSRISINTFTDAPYADLISTHYILKNGTATSNSPIANDKYYSPYTLDVASSLNIKWNGYEKKLYYTLDAASATITIPDIIDDTYSTGAGTWFNNKLYLSTNLHPLIGSYNGNNNWQVAGSTGIDIYSIASPAINNGKIYFGGYPKGNLFEYNIQQPWTLDGDNLSSYSTTALQSQTNPKLLAPLQNADAAGTNGPMYLSSIQITKNNAIIAGGDNDRITISSGRALAISTYANSSYTNLSLPEFNQFEFSSMCLSYDSLNAFIAATSNNNTQGKIYAYNPASNSITDSKTFPAGNPGKIVMFDKNTIAGVYDDVIYLFDITTGSIVWQQVLGSGQRIYAITKAPDNSICIVNMYLLAVHFKVQKFKFTKIGSSYSAASTYMCEFTDAANDENTKPISLVFGQSAQKNVFDLYITGLKSVYELNSCITIN